jgi:outer membrane immunogenic protein
MSLKSIWKTALAAVVATAVMVPAVQAADLGGRGYRSVKDEPDYGPPRYLWTGLYLGAQAGYGWGTSRHTNTNTLVTTGDFDTDGFIGGGTLGYNFQSGQVVWGIETDMSYSDVSGTGFAACALGCRSSLDWLLTVRGRVGFDMNGWMPYFTGGLAVADGFVSTNGAGSKSDTLTGWTIGGGLEIKLDRHWSVKTEYLYVDLGDMRNPIPGSPIRADFDELHIVRAGINYKF